MGAEWPIFPVLSVIFLATVIRSAFGFSPPRATCSSSDTGAKSVFEITSASATAAWRTASAKRASVAAPFSASITVTTRPNDNRASSIGSAPSV